MDDPVPQQYRHVAMAERIGLIASSFRRVLGHELAEIGDDAAAALWLSQRAILAHDTQADPVFFFGNQRALDLFETNIADFTRLPSRFSAEPLLREERQALLDRVSQHGFIEDYSGVRISAKGRRFRIERAIVWDLVDEYGVNHGQAATFDEWTDLTD